MCFIGNNYKNFNRVIKGYGFLKKDINVNTYYKYISYNYNNNKRKYNCGNIKGISRVYFNK